MRRERKNQLRTIAISDIIARWQGGQETFTEEIENFKRTTDATDTEMTRFALAIEEEIIRHKRAAFEIVKHLKTPTIRVLCQKLGDYEDQQLITTLLITRLDEFNSVIAEWRLHYEQLIMAWATRFYKDMLDYDYTYDVVLKRIKGGADIYYTAADGTQMIWDFFNNRLETWLNIETGRFKGELQAFVEDRQNIHTGPINTQTDATLKLLFAVPVPEGQKTMAEIEKEWLRLKCGVDPNCYLPRRLMDDTLYDVRSWASKSLIIVKDDWLYRRALQHLWAKIKSYPTETRDELVKRLYEECREADGMCAQGHVARLANVLVGFDEAVKGEVSLQDRMAEISRLDVSDIEKLTVAMNTLKEFKVTDAEEIRAWLEALDLEVELKSPPSLLRESIVNL
jgi:hypothetical protein